MSGPDLNLLATLDVLLAEGSVARAAKRLQLSASAMSRTLARLRETTGDPLLVRAGRGLVPSPRAIELRERVARLVQDANAVLRPAEAINFEQLTRTFTLRTSEGFVETFGPDILDRVSAQAPRVRLRFVQKPQKDSAPLREGSVDLETGVVDKTTGPEVRTATLFRDRLVAVVRAGHPLSKGPVTVTRYASGKHISVSRGTPGTDPIDEALAQLGLERDVVAFLEGGFAASLALARASQLIVAVPEHHTATLRTGMHSFALPFTMPEFTVSLLWHPRLDADLAHRWLRTCVRDVCAAHTGGSDDTTRRKRELPAPSSPSRRAKAR
ncbi:MAG TPA: LysR family transcriptional regulator [Polyangiales bacterium]|nr:LysR family transcriptional regulator [Polyangiales bacterium]